MGLADFLHQFKFLRNLGRKLAHGVSVGQSFYGGKIYVNAVEHKWSYLNGMSLENHDHELQKIIYDTSKTFEVFIDIGCNVGVMTIGTLLHNQTIRAIAVDPSKTAIQLLNKSIKANALAARCETICAGVGPADGFIYFNDNYGSAMAAINDSGNKIPQLRFSTLLNKYSHQKTLVKIDTEGFETLILQDLHNVNNLKNFRFILEVHEQGYQKGNPEKVFDLLTKNNAGVTSLAHVKLTALPANAITQVFVNF